MPVNIINSPEVSFLKDIGVYSINCAQGHEAVEWLESRDGDDVKRFNIKTDTVVEVSWGWYGDMLHGLSDYAEFYIR